jgi:hypothetical protein
MMGKERNMKKRTLFVIFGVVMGTWGCSFSAGTIATPTPGQADEVGTVVAATLQAFTPAPTESIATQPASSPAATQEGGIPVSYEGVSLVLPGTVAESVNTEKMTAVEANTDAPWNVAPTHLRFSLTGYALQDRFHEPRIFVYPAAEYAQSNPAAAEQIERLRKIAAGAPMLEETLPIIPFFNAGPLMAAQIKILPFQNGGGGVRALTQYAQYAAPINNHELFYHFQGLSADGNYYVIAILPITAPILAEDEKPEAPVPAGGIPIPTALGPNEVYYFSVTEKLNSLSPDSYTPSLTALDALIQSMTVTTP